MKKNMEKLLPLFLLVVLIMPPPAGSQECILDMSQADARFGFGGTTRTLYISNILFMGQSFTPLT